MAATIAVVYDACVLYPAPLRDLLVQLATARIFRAKWLGSIAIVNQIPVIGNWCVTAWA